MRFTPAVSDLTRVIGVQPTLELASRSPAVYVPVRDLTPAHPIVQAIGPQLALRCQRHFGGEVIRLRHARKQCRYLAMARLWKAGMPVGQIAVRFSVSERTVQRALDRVTTREIESAPNQ
jgi:hypothetical protein